MFSYYLTWECIVLFLIKLVLKQILFNTVQSEPSTEELITTTPQVTSEQATTSLSTQYHDEGSTTSMSPSTEGLRSTKDTKTPSSGAATSEEITSTAYLHGNNRGSSTVDSTQLTTTQANEIMSGGPPNWPSASEDQSTQTVLVTRHTTMSQSEAINSLLEGFLENSKDMFFLYLPFL